jgi:hypothetical protein
MGDLKVSRCPNSKVSAFLVHYVKLVLDLVIVVMGRLEMQRSILDFYK